MGDVRKEILFVPCGFLKVGVLSEELSAEK